MQSQRPRRRLLSLLLICITILAGAASATAAPNSRRWTVTPLTPASRTTLAAKNTAAQPQDTLRNGGKMISVIVKLDVESLASYRGGVAGLAPTSPSVTGSAKLNVGSPASQSYLAYVDQRQ